MYKRQDTILNLGLNETALEGLIKQTGNERFAWDAYRRFVQLFGKIALGVADEHFDACMAALKRKAGARVDLCLLYTSDAADERSSVGLGGRRILKKKTKTQIK